MPAPDRCLLEPAPVALPLAHTATPHTHPCTEFSQPCILRGSRLSGCGCAFCTAHPFYTRHPGCSCMRLRTQRLHHASCITPLRIGAGPVVSVRETCLRWGRVGHPSLSLTLLHEFTICNQLAPQNCYFNTTVPDPTLSLAVRLKADGWVPCYLVKVSGTLL